MAKYSPTVTDWYSKDRDWWRRNGGEDPNNISSSKYHEDKDGYDSYGYHAVTGKDRYGYTEGEYRDNPELENKVWVAWTAPIPRKGDKSMNPVEAMAAAIKFAEENVVECSKDLLAWKNTAILPDGKFTELSKLVSSGIGPRDCQSVAEGLVVKAALQVASGLPTPSAD